MNREQAIEVVAASLAELLERDNCLLVNDASEMAIAHKLAQYVEKHAIDLQLGAVDVDCEYNRNAVAGLGKPKRVLLLAERLEEKRREPRDPTWKDYCRATALPDIVVHRRGKD
jgi:hypothetical protein